ncbi:ent-kaurenoic acid oxidase 1-like [Juglans microcarpa x Juglans regia]|uniref:ent-kaurenoic acid oxidase 1-like n=1 Tax=Juglans microcarpa x Juglans regia TaxID=2249226 RepID=UPI001B7DE57D|nr:ent-kaurenoic acid oxidase 1-like [Juglans microcarpa x Juglans regia]
MEITTIGVWLGLLLGGLPLLGLLLWWWNELWYVFSFNARCSLSTSSATKLPPGHMGFPFLGEMLTFLWYFKILRRPDDFINSKRRKYGDGVGMYRTHLFGSPTIIACFPAVNKFIFQSEDTFLLKWPTVDILGPTSLVAVHGKSHARLRSYVSNAINRPDALRRIALQVQPLMAAALQSWAQKGKVKVYDEIKKLTFENIGRLFVSFEPGPQLDNMDKLFKGLVHGVRAYPINFHGTTYHHALQCRKKLDALFWVELEKKRKNQNGVDQTNDLMDGLMQIKDEEGNKLSSQEVIDNIVSLVAAGYESTSLASMWAVFYLAKFPNALQKLRKENMAISKKRKGDFITSEDVSEMKYANKVVEETIRMANIAPFIFRSATKETEYKGYKIPKDWKVILWVRYLHTNSENFEDPLCFNPDRWNKPVRSGTYQVFGGGPRICAGNMLASIQLALFLHHLSIGYKWELLNPNAKMAYLPHPKPIHGVEVTLSKF